MFEQAPKRYYEFRALIRQQLIEYLNNQYVLNN